MTLPPEDSPEPSASPSEESDFVAPGRRFPVCRLKRKIARRAQRGHTWIFSNEIETFEGEASDGNEIVVRDPRGRLVGTGLLSRGALIAVRLFARHVVACDAVLIRARLDQALDFRRRRVWPDGRAPEAFRVCFSEGDQLPGLIVDRYGDHVVFQTLTVGMERRREIVIGVLRDLFDPACIYERSDSPARALEGLPERAECAAGRADPELVVSIDDVRLGVDVAGGQKTGLFLDQAENWRLARRLAAGRRVLDAFSYVGCWSLWAARGGATECLGIDISKGAVERAERNARINEIGDRVRFVCEDVFAALRRFEAEKRTFDLIALDPPPFARNRRQLPDALRGYREINVRAMRLLEPGGLLFTCTCSYHVSAEDFDDVLRQAARDAGRALRLIPGPCQSPDHPMLLSTPETSYLKVRLLEVADRMP